MQLELLLQEQAEKGDKAAFCSEILQVAWSFLFLMSSSLQVRYQHSSQQPLKPWLAKDTSHLQQDLLPLNARIQVAQSSNCIRPGTHGRSAR